VREVGIKGVEYCPGPWACERWESSAPPKDDACTTCPKLPTKPITISSVTSNDERAAAALVEQVAELRSEQRAGLLDVGLLAPIEVELLKLWHRTEHELQRAS